MPNQLSMDDLLNEEKPEPAAPAAPDEPAPAPDAAAETAAKEAAEEQRKEDYRSKKNKARDKEAEAQGKVRDPATGQFVAPADAPAAPAEPAAKVDPAKPAAPPQEFTEKEKAFLRAAQEERGKRQEWERRALAAEAAKLPTAPTEPAKTFWEDPEGTLAKHDQKIQQAITNTRLQTAEMIARSRHTDFDEKVAVFMKFMETATPPQQASLANQWLSSQDPAEYAYSFGKNQAELQEAGGLDALRAKIEKETEARVRVKVEAEVKAKAEALQKERDALPPSLSDARSSSANKPVFSGPPAMEDILK